MPDLGNLFGSFFEAAATLALLFIIIGWVSSKLVEVGQTFWNAHGKMLRDELQRCFGGPEAAPFTRYFYWHPLVEPLSQPVMRLPDKLRPSDAPPDYPPGRLPAYIAPETFAAVMLNPFPWPATEEPLRQLLEGNVADSPPAHPRPPDKLPETLATNRALVDAGGTWEELTVDDTRPLALQWFDSQFRQSPVNIHAEPPAVGPTGTPPPGSTLAGTDLTRRLAMVWGRNKLVPSPLRTRMMALIQDAEGDIDRLRAGVARWYGETMDRVTGRFKRKALLYVSLVAFGICLLFNVNSIGIFSAIVENSDRRASIERARAAGNTTEETATLEAKEQFVAAVKNCEKEVKDKRALTTDCLIGTLQSLWRSPEHPNLVPSIAFDRPYEGKPWQKTQLRRARNYCLSGKRQEFCGSSLVTDLNSCIEGPRNAKGELLPRPDSAAMQGICDEAWNDIWRSPAFFWHAATASRIASGLFDRKIPAEDLWADLQKIRARAQEDSRNFRTVVAEVPGAGFIWSGDDSLSTHIEKRASGIIGILISALLAAFGAPFWYDLLGRVSRRGAGGPKPDGA